MYVTLLKTESNGEVSLNDKKIVEYPTTENNPNSLTSSVYLANAVDKARLQDGMRQIYKIMTEENGVESVLPKDESSITNAVGSYETSHLIVNSWSSSCQVGTCLDGNFRVKQTTNVFVADASAMPQVPVPPVGTVMAVAKVAGVKIANVIPEDPTPTAVLPQVITNPTTAPTLAPATGAPTAPATAPGTPAPSTSVLSSPL
jgi:choline dehydrogenase-like flavoprotein